VLRFNYASLNPNSTYNQKDIFGGGIGISVKTPIGPLQFILSQSNKQDLMRYLNIGYNF
jgi:outer membrane translocation and assembly module TamA